MERQLPAPRPLSKHAAVGTVVWCPRVFQKKGTQVEKIWPAFLATDPDSGQHIRHAVPPCIGSALACPLSFGHIFGAVCLRKRGGRMYGHVWYLPSGGKTKDGRAWIDLSSSCCFSALDDRPPVSMEVDQSKSAPRQCNGGTEESMAGVVVRGAGRSPEWSGGGMGGTEARMPARLAADRRESCSRRSTKPTRSALLVCVEP